MARRKRKSTSSTRRRRPRPRPGRKSTAKGVKRLKASDFAYPKTREYPLNTRKRARAALAYSKRKTTSGSYAHVARRVKSKYPDMKLSSGSKKKKKRR